MNMDIYFGIYWEHLAEIAGWIKAGIRYINTAYAKLKLAVKKHFKIIRNRKTNLPFKYKFEIWRIKCTFLLCTTIKAKPY